MKIEMSAVAIVVTVLADITKPSFLREHSILSRAEEAESAEFQRRERRGAGTRRGCLA